MPFLNTQPYRAKALKSVMDNVIAVVFHVCFYVNNSFCNHVQLTKGGLLFETKCMILYL